MTPIILESPCQAGTSCRARLHRLYAAACLRDAILRGEAPFAGHVLYAFSGALDDRDPEERRLGREAGYALAMGLVAGDGPWGPDVAQVLYVDLGVSPGMAEDRGRFGVEVVERRLGFGALMRLLVDWRRACNDAGGCGSDHGGVLGEVGL